MPTTTTFAVSGMTCDHCVAAVTQEVGGLDGVDRVDVALVPDGDSLVTVTSDRALLSEEIRAAVEEAGYELSAGGS
jgi:copper ion binding protein